ncbi:MAG: TRCF domain-containing protein [Nostoc sp.]
MTSTIESDRYGSLPVRANQLLRVMELKQLAKKIGFSALTPNTLLLAHTRRLQLANTRTVRYCHICLSTPFYSVPANSSFSLRPEIQHHLHSSWGQ